MASPVTLAEVRLIDAYRHAAAGVERSKIRTANPFGVKPAGSVQLIVGLTPLAELVIVTLEGNGSGVNDSPAVVGNGNVAVAVAPPGPGGV